MWEDSDIDDHTFQNTSAETYNVSNAMCDRIFDKKQSCHQWGTDADFFSMEENIFSKSSLERHAADRDNYGALDSAWGSESHKVYETSTELFTPSTDMHNHYFCKNDQEDPFLLVSPRQGDKSSLRKFNSLEKNPTDSMLFSNLQSHGVEFDIFRIKEYEISSDDIISIANSCSFEVDCSYLKENLWDEKAADPRLRFGALRKCQNNFDVDLSPEHSPFTECFAKYRNAVAQVGEKSVAFQSTEQGQCSGSPLYFLQDADYFTEKYATIEDHISRKNLRSRCFSNGGVGDEHVNDIQNNSVAEDFLTMNSPNTWRNWFTSRTNHRKHSHFKHPLHEKKFSNANPSSTLDGETDETFPDFSIKNKTNNCVKSVFDKSDDMSTSDRDMDMLDFRDLRRSWVSNLRSRRSHSAPPFYKGKNKYSLSQDCFNGAFGSKNHENSSHVDHTPSETSHDVDNPLGDSKSYGIPIEISLSYSREHMKRDQFCIPDMKDMEARHQLEHPPCFHRPDSVVTEDIVPNKLEEPNINLTKWRNGEPQPTDADLGGFCGKSHMVTGHEDDILDVSSGPLHLAGGLLVPQSISRDYLLNATVLQQQLDKKFIPVMAGGVLAIVDQHAADERIRLEELRRKVLSGEGKETTFLESEQELVPCILGINLTDKDLMEFLQQLAETDGSSAVPPSVLRVLSFKACRGAIMFGDSLLPSECSLIIEELKETSLCFQCAHGRPTTVPLISLPALRKQLARLELQSGGRPERWHGLHRQAPSLDRARLRLSSAKGLKA
ncbi:DNA mismatch repair protein MLH3 [Acorus calamus]|uniref:DNA mismatch repair protein MLH3 n=1 Tax=Acorus calamus TaxID=4465 RepID=A0AAV9DSI6_ACOCL|nr:DNA mismatch repair protein MLH3 [Acorus calamus]